MSTVRIEGTFSVELEFDDSDPGQKDAMNDLLKQPPAEVLIQDWIEEENCELTTTKVELLPEGK